MAGLGAGVLVLVVALAKDQVLEEWHLRRFRTGDREAKLAAAGRLADLESREAVPLIIEEIAKGIEEEMDRRARAQGGMLTGDPRQYLDPYGEELMAYLIRFGKPALPGLMLARTAPDLETALVWLLTIDKVDPRFARREPYAHEDPSEPLEWSVLREIAATPGESEEIRAAAVETLERLEERWRTKRVR